jgi:hypothetical protein
MLEDALGRALLRLRRPCPLVDRRRGVRVARDHTLGGDPQLRPLVPGRRAEVDVIENRRGLGVGSEVPRHILELDEPAARSRADRPLEAEMCRFVGVVDDGGRRHNDLTVVVAALDADVARAQVRERPVQTVPLRRRTDVPKTARRDEATAERGAPIVPPRRPWGAQTRS